MFGGRVSFASWNARALFHQSMPERRAAKIAVVRGALHNLDLLVLQEVHGSWEDVVADFHDFMPIFEIMFYEGPSIAIGALLIFSRK